MKRFVSFFVMLAAAVCIGAFSAGALSTISADAYCEQGYSVRDRNILAPDPSNADFVTLPDFSSGNKWTCTGMISSSFTHDSGGVLYYCANIKNSEDFEHRTGGATFSFDLSAEKIDVTDCTAFEYAVGIRGSETLGKGFFVNTYIVTSKGSTVAQTCAPASPSASELSLVCVDLSAVSGEIRSIRVVIYYNEEKLPDSVRISSPFFTKKDMGFSVAKKYLTSSFASDNGSINMKNGVVTTDRNGDATLRGYYTGKLRNCKGKAYLFVETDGIKSGAMQTSITYCEDETGRVITLASQKISIVSGEREHVFPFEIKGTIMSFTVDFVGVTAENGGVRLNSAAIYDTSAIAAIKGVGKVGSISYDGRNARFSGSVEREFAKANAGSSIGFFALTAEDSADTAVVLGSIDITTKFEFTADLTGLPLSVDTYMFLAAVVTESGEIIPISQPRYFDSQGGARENGPKLGFADTPAVSAFESNASHIIIDVPFDELLLNRGKTMELAYTVYGGGEYSSQSVSLDRSLLDRLDADVNFCSSAGMKVYLRLFSSAPIDGLTFGAKGADNYAFCIKNSEYRHLYAALVRFLAKRYSGISGFVIGTDAARASATGAKITADPAEYIDRLAEVCRVTYSASFAYLNDPLIIVPISSNGDISDKTAGLMLRDRTDDLGGAPIAFMHCVDDLGEEQVGDRLYKLLAEMGFGESRGRMIMFSADEEKLLRDYTAQSSEEYGSFPDYVAARIEKYCVDQSTADAVIVSLAKGELGGTRELFSALKSKSDSGATVLSLNCSGTTDGMNMYPVWDFSDKYYDLGWRAIGVSSCRSDFGKLGAAEKHRALCASFDKGENGAAGILLCSLDATSDFSSADRLAVTLAASSEESESASVIVMLGTDSDRAEYFAEIPAGGSSQTLVCDLTEYARRSNVDFVGAMIYSDAKTDVEIERVELASVTADKKELGGIFEPQTADEGEKNDSTLLLVVTAVGAMLTVAIFFMMFRHDRETAENSRNDYAETKRRERMK